MTVQEYINHYFSQSAKEPLPDTALFLVGSNPLPLYVTARALEPKTILLLGTSKVKEVMDRLGELLGSQVAKMETCEEANSLDIQNKTASLMKGAGKVWLFYTAGTKAMAVHSHEKWRNLIGGHCAHWGVYLSPDGRLWFDAAQPFSLSPFQRDYSIPKLSLDETIRLHRIVQRHMKDRHQDDKYSVIAESIHIYVLKHGMATYKKLLPPCHTDKVIVNIPEIGAINATGEISFLNDANLKDDSIFCRISLTSWLRELSLPGTYSTGDNLDMLCEILRGSPKATNHGTRQKERVNLLKLLEGTWLELWVAKSLTSSGLFHEVHDSFEFQIPDFEKKCEVDVCAMRGHTPFVFSCTVDHSSSLGKHKLFEVRLRANQLGGDHARAAVVCLSDNPDGIERELNQGWAGYGTIKVFGKSHIRNATTFIESVESWVMQLET